MASRNSGLSLFRGISDVIIFTVSLIFIPLILLEANPLEILISGNTSVLSFYLIAVFVWFISLIIRDKALKRLYPINKKGKNEIVLVELSYLMFSVLFLYLSADILKNVQEVPFLSVFAKYLLNAFEFGIFDSSYLNKLLELYAAPLMFYIVIIVFPIIISGSIFSFVNKLQPKKINNTKKFLSVFFIVYYSIFLLFSFYVAVFDQSAFYNLNSINENIRNTVFGVPALYYLYLLIFGSDYVEDFLTKGR